MAHPFLWDGHHLRDLGTLSGNFGAANQVNDAGVVAGWATLPGDNIAHAFLWKGDVMTDLTGTNGNQHVFLLTPTGSALGAAASSVSRQPGGNFMNLISTPGKRFLPRG